MSDSRTQIYVLIHVPGYEIRTHTDILLFRVTICRISIRFGSEIAFTENRLKYGIVIFFFFTVVRPTLQSSTYTFAAWLVSNLNTTIAGNIFGVQVQT